MDVLIQLGVFTAKVIILALFIILILITFFVLLAKSKEKNKGQLHIKNLNKKYEEQAEVLLTETLDKKELKKFHKQKKALLPIKKNIYLLHFNGDIRASQVAQLREEINAILTIAKPGEEVVVCVESAGGVVHGYGLAAAQLMRLTAHKLKLTIAIDKVAASGGYMMACIADRILCAPFAIVGSIGVIVQLPNFHRLLKEKHIDFEQHTAGEFKRTITVFGENTKAGREKLQHEVEEIHYLFKKLIHDHRPAIDIDKVATGEHWYGEQAIALGLVDEIKTSDEYLLEASKKATIYEICYEVKKSFLSKFTAAASAGYYKLLGY